MYRLRFQARRVQGTTGLPVSGPAFCNRDLASLGSEWTAFESFFLTPQQLTDDMTRLRFGQWEVNGTVAFDNVRVEPVTPVYQRNGELPHVAVARSDVRTVHEFERNLVGLAGGSRLHPGLVVRGAVMRGDQLRFVHMEHGDHFIRSAGGHPTK